MKIDLYYAPLACSLVPYVTLTETGAPFTVHTINMRKGQQMSPEYLKLNPKHKVPLLVVDGKTLTENVAIQTWMDRTFPAAKLLPSDPWENIKAISMMAWCSSGIHPFLTRINNPAKVCDAPGSADGVVAAAKYALDETFRIADEMLAGREHFFAHFTAPDVHFHWCMRRGRQLGVDTSAYPNCEAHYARMEARPSIQKVNAFEKATMDEFAKAG